MNCNVICVNTKNDWSNKKKLFRPLVEFVPFCYYQWKKRILEEVVFYIKLWENWDISNNWDMITAIKLIQSFVYSMVFCWNEIRYFQISPTFPCAKPKVYLLSFKKLSLLVNLIFFNSVTLEHEWTRFGFIVRRRTFKLILEDHHVRMKLLGCHFDTLVNGLKRLAIKAERLQFS